MKGLKLEDILTQIDSAVGSTKEAAATPTPTPPVAVTPVGTKIASDADVLAAINAALEDTTKTAAEMTNSPVSDLMKLAEEINEQQFDGLLKKADILAQAIADGVVTRLQSYEKAASELQHAQTVNVFDSVPSNLKTAAEQGYTDAHAHMTKLAEDLFVSGYNKTAEIITHRYLFTKAASIMDELIANLPQE